MKLEPVGYYNPDTMDEAAAGKRGGGVILWARQSEDNDRVPAYTIPEGYVVVPVEQAKNAERYAWLRDKSFGQYAHPIVIEQRPEGFVPRYLGPLFGDILDSYVDIAIDQTANKAMIAAKEQS